MMKTVLIGSVTSSEVVLKVMIDTQFPIDYVFSLDERKAEGVSGYRPIHELAEKNGIPYKKFTKIGDRENIDILRQIEPDYIFVIGLSQLVKADLLATAKKGVIGFHPTPLPKFRGRAAMVWQMLLGVHQTKCSMFLLDEGMDSGDILIQEPYVIDDTDYACDVEKKLCQAIERMTKKLLPQILNNSICPWKQNEEEATYLLRRTPEDGLINWNDSIEQIYRLIRAVSRPYPGAYGNYDGEHKVIIWRAECLKNDKYYGINGQIAWIAEEYFDVVCRDGLLRVWEHENVDNVKLFVGHKLC